MKKIFKVVWVLLMALMLTASFVGCAAITGIKGDKGTEGLDYYPLPDGTYGVKMGTAHLTDVYYTGSETDAEAISFGSENDYLKNATWHYNYVPTEN